MFQHMHQCLKPINKASFGSSTHKKKSKYEKRHANSEHYYYTKENINTLPLVQEPYTMDSIKHSNKVFTPRYINFMQHHKGTVPFIEPAPVDREFTREFWKLSCRQL